VIDYLRRNPDLARTILGKYTEANVYSKRWSELLGVGNDISKILTMTDIQYISPGNAASMAFGDASFDFHISNNVLEHVKPADIVSILEEGKRLLKTSGLFIHKVDFSDHFSHSDKAISSVNFLRYNEVEWRGIAGNRFMFHNRLRINEFMQLLAGTGLKFLAVDAEIDQESLKLLEDGLLVLDPRFTSNSNVDNATRTAWITATA
jgi:SAM-dependent methyltransferase